MNEPRSQSGMLTVWACGATLVFLSGLLTRMSAEFTFTSSPPDRPLIGFIALMSVMFAVHWIAFRAAWKIESTNTHRKAILVAVWSVALLSRFALIPSQPIQEVDLYRYLWDGRVAVSGVSPFRYSPDAVIAATKTAVSDPELAVLANVANEHASQGTILYRVHFGYLPTVYPPISQCVFAMVTAIVPATASVHTHVMALKLAIVAFDTGIIAVVAWLLTLTRLNRAWLITYAWNPLVLKEFAGSGHLDSIAVFFTVLSVTFAIKAIQRESFRNWLSASFLLAIGFGAKLYPIILLPVLVYASFQSTGTRKAAGVAFVFAVTASICLLPVAITFRPAKTAAIDATDEDRVSAVDEFEPPLPDNFGLPESDETASNPTDGIATFLSQWEMNDLIFLIVVENLKSTEEPPWFCVTPPSLRQNLTAWSTNRRGGNGDQASFLIARAITLIIFGAASLWLILRMPPGAPIAYGQTAFVIIALFWMLSPTLNPWYWTWALPLICFARSRGWLLVSAMLPLYYLRFWMLYHGDHGLNAYLPYEGVATFDFVITFVEHAPWMAAVIIGGLAGDE